MIFAKVEFLEPRQMLTAYYVSPAGIDTNPGTLTLPFKTVQKAATTMAAGDTAFLRAGIYRESVRPARSGTPGAPITFMPYQNESVTLSGADVIAPASWSLLQDGIYRAPMSANLGDANQVFVDGQMINAARYPNTSLDVSRPTKLVVSSVTTAGSGTTAIATISAPELNSFPAGFWTGASLNIALGKVWVQETKTVTASAPGSISFTYTTTDPNYLPTAGNPFYLIGDARSLDAPGEWYHDPSTGLLSIKTPLVDSPALHTVEVRVRDTAFDLSSRSWINLTGLNLFASKVITDATTSDVTLDRLDVRYPSHFQTMTRWGKLTDAGVSLLGSNNTLRTSTIAYAAGNGVLVNGTDNKVFNNVVHDVGYGGIAGAGISTGYVVTTRPTIRNNTVYNSSLRLIELSKVTGGETTFNDLSVGGLQFTDFGAIYAYQTDGGTHRIGYNRIHDLVQTLPGGLANNSKGIYLDNSSDNFVVDHNVIWNVLSGLILNADPSVGQSNTDHVIYNNTIYGNSRSYGWNYTPIDRSQIFNNIFRTGAAFGTGGTVSANLSSGVDPLFVDAPNDDFRLKSGSPAINAGIVVSPYTDGYVGTAPDQGAYEFDPANPGAAAWSAGASGAYSRPAALKTPASFAATVVSSAQVNLSWTSVDPVATSLQLEMSTDGQTWTSHTLQITARTFAASVLAGSTRYFFRLRALSGAGALADAQTSALTSAFMTLTTASDIGTFTPAGSNSYDATTPTYTVTAAGADIWNTSDQFRFVRQSLTGDGSIVARVTSLGNTNGFAKAGVMFRASTSVGDVNALLALTPGNGVQFQYRAVSGGTSTTTGVGAAVPAWLKLTRAENTFTAWYSTSAALPLPAEWVQVGSAVALTSMPASALVGLALTSHNSGVATTAAFANVSVVAPPASVSSIIDDGTAQRSMLRSVTVTFDKPVNLATDALSLLRSGVSPSFITSLTNSSGDGRTNKLTFSGTGVVGASIPDGLYTLGVAQAGAIDVFGQSLVGGDRTFSFHRLFGDADGDRDVDGTDSRAFRSALNTTSTSAAYRSWFDYDSDLDVDGTDSRQFRLRLNTNI